jgi:hypothetical protein
MLMICTLLGVLQDGRILARVAPRKGVHFGFVIITPGRIPGLLHFAPNGARAREAVAVSDRAVGMQKPRPVGSGLESNYFDWET